MLDKTVGLPIVILLLLAHGFVYSDNLESSSNVLDNLIAQLFRNLTLAKDALTSPEMWPQDYAEEFLSNEPPLVHDYIVVGAGTAGSVVASRLSENPNISVLVVEAGSDPPSMSEVYTLSGLLQNTPYTWNDYAEPNPTSCQAMKNGRCFWQRGKIVSGTGGINGNVFLIGRPEDYDDWRAQGNSGWDWQDIYQYFVKATEDQSSPDNPKGSLVLNHFPRMDNFHILTELMTNATAEIEAPLANKSPGYMPNILATVERGKRMSTGKTYLGKVAKYRRNLHVLKNAEVRKIIFNRHKKAVGLEVMLNNTKALNIRGRKEIILSAGTFNSPQILMRSGIGPCRHLMELNITCLKDLAVGENLQDHGMMSLTLKFTKNIPVMPESDTLTNTFEYLAFQKGPLASHKNLVGFINSRDAENINRTDLMLVSGINRPARGSNMFEFLQFREDFVENFLEIAENLTTLEIQGLLIKPKSRGYIKLKSAELGSGPIIYNNYATAEEDRQTLLRMVRYIQKLQKSEIFRHYGLQFIRLPLEDCDLLPFESDEYWLCYVKYFYISSWHGVGTCRMGPQSDALAVVDSQLRVHGVNGLRVIDASIMPNITSANTNGPTIMIGEKGAHMIMEELANAIGDV